MHLFYDVLSFVCTWMRLMMCYMFVLHVDASSLGCWARGCPYGCKCGCNAVFLVFYIYMDEMLWDSDA